MPWLGGIGLSARTLPGRLAVARVQRTLRKQCGDLRRGRGRYIRVVPALVTGEPMIPASTKLAPALVTIAPICSAVERDGVSVDVDAFKVLLATPRPHAVRLPAGKPKHDVAG